MQQGMVGSAVQMLNLQPKFPGNICREILKKVSGK